MKVAPSPEFMQKFMSAGKSGSNMPANKKKKKSGGESRLANFMKK